MEKSNWIPLAALIAAIIVPFSNSLFQDWLRKRSERIASANPALAQPNATTHAGSFPVGANRFITRRGRWFIISVQVLAGAIALMLIQALWPATTISKWVSIALAALLFVSVQALPWVTKRFPKARPAQSMLKRFGVLWDEAENPHCPVDRTLLHLSGSVKAEPGRGAYDILQCPKCSVDIPLYGDHGHQTLFSARNMIRDFRRRGLISD